MKNHTLSFLNHLSLLSLPALLAVSCQASGYTSSLKSSSRDLKVALLENVRASREEQAASQVRFASACDLLTELTRNETEDPEALYEQLLGEIDKCAECAEDLRDRIPTLEQDAAELFEILSVELEQFSHPDMRSRSEAMLKHTQESFGKLIAQFEHTQEQVEVVMLALRDFVLFFNQNLNARAVGTLEDENDFIVEELETLEEETGSAINEVDTFIEVLEGR